jgi:hypothetical protein
MPGLFDDDFIYGALGRARNPIADFLEQASPARGISNYAGPVAASPQVGANDFIGTSTRAAGTLANWRQMKAEQEKAQNNAPGKAAMPRASLWRPCRRQRAQWRQ